MSNENLYTSQLDHDDRESERLIETNDDSTRYHSVPSDTDTDTPQQTVEPDEPSQETTDQAYNWEAYRRFTIVYNFIEFVTLFTILVSNWSKPCGDSTTRTKLYVFTILYIVGDLCLIAARVFRLRTTHHKIEQFLVQFTSGIGIILLFAAIQSNSSGAEKCSATNKPLFATIISVAIVNIATSFAPLLLLLLLIFCLPCIMIFLPRLARFFPMVPVFKAATEDEIALLPSFEFDENFAHAGYGYPASLSNYTPPPSSSSNPHSYQQAQEEPQCAVCLMEYEPGQSLRRFHCRHDFHKECVDNWLLQSAICPACRADVFEHFERGQDGQLIAPIFNMGGVNSHGTTIPDSIENNSYAPPIPYDQHLVTNFNETQPMISDDNNNSINRDNTNDKKTDQDAYIDITIH